MSQIADYNVSNQSGAAVRSDINNIFLAVASANSGTAEPSTMYPFMIWVDTTNNLVKLRNGANDAWLTLPYSMTASNTVDINGGTVDGITSLSVSGTSDLDGAVTINESSADVDFRVESNGNANMLFVDGGADAVGIGVVPTYTLDVYKSAIGNVARFNSSSGNRSLNITSADNGVYLGAVWQRDINSSGGIHTWSNNGTERLRVDSAGTLKSSVATGVANLILDNDADTPYMRFDESSASKFYIGESSVVGGGSGYYDFYGAAGIGQRFFTGAAQRMTILSTGNIGIGTSSPSSPNSVNTFLQIHNSDHSSLILSDDQNTWEMVSNNSLSFRDGTDTRMTIDTSGNIGIGESAPANPVHIKTADVGITPVDTAILVLEQTGTNYINFLGGTTATQGLRFGDSSDTGAGYFIYNHTDNSLQWGTNGPEKMRLDGSGNLLIGKTGTARSSGNGTFIAPNHESMSLVSTQWLGNADFWHAYSSSAGAYRFYIDWAGTIHATSTSITAISDRSLKENIVDLETGLAEVIALKPRRFDWKNPKYGGVNNAGFIAQEVETVLPDLVEDSKYSPDGETKKAVKMGDMLPTLVKAIQELSAEVEQLKQQAHEKCEN